MKKFAYVIAAGVLALSSTAFAQTSSEGASRREHQLNPPPAGASTGGQTSSAGASRREHQLNPQDMPAKTGTQQPATNQSGQLPERNKDK
jgi:hypothetical protein